jgi:sporulation protein YlmC with PRC-barrel domain
MNRIPQLGMMTAAAALIAVPVLAQNAPTPSAAPNGTTGTGGSALSANPGTTGGDTGASPRAMPGTSAMTAPNAPGRAGDAGNGAGGIGNAPANSSATTAPSGSAANGNGTASNAPSDKNPVLTDDGQVRASKVIGSSVYNDKNEKIGSIDDILMGKDNQPATAIISVGGFLGMGAKLVSVPYDKLQFGDTASNNGNRVVMPGASKDALNGMPDYHYSKAG